MAAMAARVAAGRRLSRTSASWLSSTTPARPEGDGARRGVQADAAAGPDRHAQIDELLEQHEGLHRPDPAAALASLGHQSAGPRDTARRASATEVTSTTTRPQGDQRSMVAPSASASTSSATTSAPSRTIDTAVGGALRGRLGPDAARPRPGAAPTGRSLRAANASRVASS